MEDKSDKKQKTPEQIRARKQLLIGVGVCFAIIAIFVGYLIYASRPQPVRFKVTGTAPQATALREGAKPDKIHINFSGSAARLEAVGKPVINGLNMTPVTGGQWLWSSDSRLTFTPAEDWKVGRHYTVTLDKTLFPDHVLLDKYEYEFYSASFTQRIIKSEFYHDPVDPKIKRAVVTVKFSHPVDTLAFEEAVHLRMADKKKKGVFSADAESYPFTVSYDKFKGEAYIKSEPLSIPPKDTHMVVTVSGGEVASARGGPVSGVKLETNISIPGMYSYFRIRASSLQLVRNERYDPEQVLIIETTDGVLESELQENLKVYVLPRDLPVLPGSNRKKAVFKYHWSSTSMVGPEVLALSTPVELEPIPTEKEYSKLHSFKYKAEVGKYIYVKLDKGIESRGGYILAKVFDNIRRVPSFPKELEIMHDGALLSMSGEKKLSILSRGIKGVKFEIARVLPEDINHLVTQTYGDLKNPYFRNWDFNQDNISERFEKIKILKDIGPAKAQYTSFDFTSYLRAGKKRGLFFFTVNGWDPVYKRTTGGSDKRLIMITDLGLLVKDNADGTHDVFVQSLGNGRPAVGALVQVLGKNGLAVAAKTTGTDGHVKFPKMKDFKREKQPVAYFVRKGEDISFIPFARSERVLNLSRFDIGGVRTSGKSDNLNAYLFSERGIYRPGDEFRVGLIVKPTDWTKSVSGVPLEVVITDARGLVVKKNMFSLSQYGFDEVKYKTEETSPTGNYQISVYIIKDGYRRSFLGSTTVKVEEFLPDRMRITTRFSTQRLEGWVSPEGLRGMVSLKNLFGTPASDRRVKASINLSPAYPRFRAYKDYNFFDPLKAKRGFTERLKDQTTDDEGLAEFDLGLKRFEKATYRVRLTTEGFEAQGGRGVLSESAVLVSPLDYLIGYKADGDLRYINKDSLRSVELIAVGPELSKLSVEGLKVRIVEQRYVSALTRQRSGLYKYQSVLKETTLTTEPLEILAEGMHYTLPTDEPGDYALVIEDASETELNKIAFSVVGRANLTRNLEKNAELQVRLNKGDFAPGEEIEIAITAPYVGSGLITIERDKVYRYKWFTTSTTSAVKKIRVPNDLEGNGYVNVSFVRAIDSEEIFMSPLSYGVAPFTVSKDKHDIKVALDVVDIARPGEPFSIKYKSERPGKAMIFAVDEGILQVANYKTPDPLAHFFEKRALEVKTSQILDLLLPEFKLLKDLSGVGGGYFADEEALGKNLNPFKRKRLKPAVYWSGIVDVGTDERELIYNVPDYFNGTLRVMAVAVSNEAIGAASKKSLVRGHFVLSPNVPTFVAPGDEFTVSLGVSNNVDGSGEAPSVSVELKTSKHLEVLDENIRLLNIGEGKEKSTTYKVRATSTLGSGKLSFTVSMGNKKSTYSIELSVRPSVPYMTTIESGYFRSETVDALTARKMYPHYRTLEASASTVPLSLAQGLLKFLQRFPYGCTEQLVSKAFPAIVLRSRPAFGYSPEKIESNLAGAIHILRARQNSEGGFGYWTANSHVSNYLSVYAVHFLTEAKDKGYTVPKDLLDKGLSYLKKVARGEDSNSRQRGDYSSLAAMRTRAYAIYILTRNGNVTTNYINALLKDLEASDRFEDIWRKDPIGIYLAGTYKMLKEDGKAVRLIKKSHMGEMVKSDYRNYYDRLMHDAQYLYILSRHFPERVKKLSPEDVISIVEEIAKGSYNTISSSFTILALDAYAEVVGTPLSAKLEMSELVVDSKGDGLDKKLKEAPLVVPAGLFPVVDFSDKAEKIRFSAEGDYYIFYQATQAGFDLTLPQKEIKEKLEIQRDYRDPASGNVLKNTNIGSEVEVHLKIRTVGGEDIENVAVVEMLPGGFEVVLDSVRGNRKSSWRPDYVDAREDRIVIFGTARAKVEEYVYRIKAINKGEYSVPPIFGESMYDRTVKARSPGDKIIVKGN